MIRLFEISGKAVIPTEHCKVIPWLKIIEVKWPEKSIQLYGYIFYMTNPGPENPYFNLKEDFREETILQDMPGLEPFLEEDEIIHAIERAKKLFETPAVRAYKGIATMLDNMSDYMAEHKISTGRDGNMASLISLGKNYKELRDSFKGIQKELEDEQAINVRGDLDLAYDQQQ